MGEITDQFMTEQLGRTRTYSVVLLKHASRYGEPDAAALIWEHGRRNFQLKADGPLVVVCPVTDDTDLAGIGIFDATPAETASIMDDDPAVQAGVLSYEVHPVRGFPGDALPPADLSNTSLSSQDRLTFWRVLVHENVKRS